MQVAAELNRTNIMEIAVLERAGAFLLLPKCFNDERGFFVEQASPLFGTSRPFTAEAAFASLSVRSGRGAEFVNARLVPSHPPSHWLVPVFPAGIEDGKPPAKIERGARYPELFLGHRP
jgi:hypothetical protein